VVRAEDYLELMAQRVFELEVAEELNLPVVAVILEVPAKMVLHY
jgi:hypothetical protein